jgi:hypothetical protein
MKNPSDTIGNRTHDHPACSTVPQPTAPTRAPIITINNVIIKAGFMQSGFLLRKPYFCRVKGRITEKHRGVEGTEMKRIGEEMEG